MSRSVEIVCTACGEDAMIRREPVYEGFTKTGERCVCVSCGHVYASEEEVPFKASSRPDVFSDSDRSKIIDVFKDDEKGHTCLHCRHYVLNPFVQRCGLTQKLVEATDTCGQFDPAEEADDAAEKQD